MQYLGQVTAHASAFSCGEHNGQGSSSCHARSMRKPACRWLERNCLRKCEQQKKPRPARHDRCLRKPPAQAGGSSVNIPGLAPGASRNRQPLAAAWLRYAAPQPAMAMEGIAGVKWRRRESNPRPVMFQPRRLRAYSVNLNLVTGPPADRVPPQPARNKFNPVRIGR